MDNDKAFAVYALLLFVGVVTLLSVLVTVVGTGTWPTPVHLAEHVGLGLAIRFAYKWIGGFNVADWTVVGERVREPAAATEMLGAPSDTADAMS